MITENGLRDFCFELSCDGQSVPCIGIEPLSANDYGEIYKSDYCEVYSDTVCQFTGLLDKNGKKIFEGDIVKAEYGETYDDVSGECFPAGAWVGFVEHEEARYIINTNKEYIPALCNICVTELEVIGTIYDKED